MAKPCTPNPIPQAAQLFELQTANVRGQGGSPLAFLWGFQRGCSLWKENTPFDRQQRLRAAFSLRAVRGKKHPACKATTLYTPWCKTTKRSFMSEKLVTKGIVLRATATKEADYILNILTDSLGRITVVARGARRKGSRIAAGSELLAFSELVLYQRGNWYYLDEASTISLFDGIRRDIELLSLASYFAEMTECVTAEDEPVPEILSLLLNSLYALDTLQKPQSIVKAAFELKLLALSGYEPLLDGCAVCGTHNPKEPVFDAQQGVLLCRECAGHGGGGLLPLDAGSFAAMRHVLFSEPKRMLSFSLSGETEKRFAAACEVFAQVQLDRRFKTLDFYKSMKIDN